jgi:hypothetical protein
LQKGLHKKKHKIVEIKRIYRVIKPHAQAPVAVIATLLVGRERERKIT